MTTENEKGKFRMDNFSFPIPGTALRYNFAFGVIGYAAIAKPLGLLAGFIESAFNDVDREVVVKDNSGSQDLEVPPLSLDEIDDDIEIVEPDVGVKPPPATIDPDTGDENPPLAPSFWEMEYPGPDVANHFITFIRTSGLSNINKDGDCHEVDVPGESYCPRKVLVSYNIAFSATRNGKGPGVLIRNLGKLMDYLLTVKSASFVVQEYETHSYPNKYGETVAQPIVPRAEQVIFSVIKTTLLHMGWPDDYEDLDSVIAAYRLHKGEQSFMNWHNYDFQDNGHGMRINLNYHYKSFLKPYAKRS